MYISDNWFKIKWCTKKKKKPTSEHKAANAANIVTIANIVIAY